MFPGFRDRTVASGGSNVVKTEIGMPMLKGFAKAAAAAAATSAEKERTRKNVKKTLNTPLPVRFLSKALRSYLFSKDNVLFWLTSSKELSRH